jgi:cell wall-associated NlpC family hydrolase
MHFTSRGAGRTLLVALLATGVLICAASSVTAREAAASATREHSQRSRAAHAAAARARARHHHLQLARRRMHRLTARVVHVALEQLGIRYRYGGGSPGYGFDCSGLVAWSFASIGIQLPHSSYLLARLGRSVPPGSLRPGDVLVFHGASHVGLYIGDGKFVHAPHSGTTVSVTSLAGAYRARLDTARRVLAWPRPTWRPRQIGFLGSQGRAPEGRACPEQERGRCEGLA